MSQDDSLTGKEDIVMETALKPFTDAGLDVSKLPDGSEEHQRLDI